MDDKKLYEKNPLPDAGGSFPAGESENDVPSAPACPVQVRAVGMAMTTLGILSLLLSFLLFYPLVTDHHLFVGLFLGGLAHLMTAQGLFTLHAAARWIALVLLTCDLVLCLSIALLMLLGNTLPAQLRLDDAMRHPDLLWVLVIVILASTLFIAAFRALTHPSIVSIFSDG